MVLHKYRQISKDDNKSLNAGLNKKDICIQKVLFEI